MEEKKWDQSKSIFNCDASYPSGKVLGDCLRGDARWSTGFCINPGVRQEHALNPKLIDSIQQLANAWNCCFFFAFCGSHNFVRCASPPANAHTLGQFPRKTDWPNDVQSWMSCTIAYLGATVQQRRTKHNNDQCYNSSITTCEPATFNTLQRMENYVRMQVESGPGLRILI